MPRQGAPRRTCSVLGGHPLEACCCTRMTPPSPHSAPCIKFRRPVIVAVSGTVQISSSSPSAGVIKAADRCLRLCRNVIGSSYRLCRTTLRAFVPGMRAEVRFTAFRTNVLPLSGLSSRNWVIAVEVSMVQVGMGRPTDARPTSDLFGYTALSQARRLRAATHNRDGASARRLGMT